jgi:hypothetical protein
MAGALSKLLYLGAIAEARHLVANRRSAGVPLPAIRQYADAQLVVFLVVDDGAGDQYDLAAAPRGEAHAVTGIKGRLFALAHFCVSMMGAVYLIRYRGAAGQRQLVHRLDSLTQTATALMQRGPLTVSCRRSICDRTRAAPCP